MSLSIATEFLSDRQGWDAVQRLVNLDPDHGGKAQRNDSRAQLVRMNLAALVVPCVISCVCVLVGLMTLNEYCLFAGDGDGDASAAFAESVPHSPQKRCFRHGDQEGLASTVSRFDFAHETRILSYAKIAAVSFYAASLLPTAMSVAFPGGKVGPLKKSLALYHILICVWSVFYYTLDFFEFVPLVRSDRDGQLEYSAVRVLAVWPVTSTLMISKIAVLSMMTRRPKNIFIDDSNKETRVEDGDDTVVSPSRLIPFVSTFNRLLNARTARDELMSTSWDVWGVSLVNNLMLLAGAFGLLADRYEVRVVSMGISCSLFVVIMFGFQSLFQQVIERVQHPEDAHTLKMLERATYGTWTLFPVIQLLREWRVINTVTQFLLMTAADIVAKMTYSTMLVFSNFWLINSADGLMRLDERLFTDALEVSKYSQLAARTLQKAKIEAESVSQLHRAFVANISHELRTPLNSIIAFNSLLMEDETLTEAQREFVSSAIVSAEALLGIIGQILDFAKLESGSETHQTLVLENFALDEMMNELVDIVGHQASRNQVEMILDVCPSLCGVVVRGDKFRLRQALINVVNNSLKYTREGGEVVIRVDRIPGSDMVLGGVDGNVRLGGNGNTSRQNNASPSHPKRADSGSWLVLAGTSPGEETEVGMGNAPATRRARTRRTTTAIEETTATGTTTPGPDLRWIRMEVIDTGIGIAKDKLEVVFKPFGQASTSSTREYGGTGLGLAITKNIMASLRGHVSCASVPGVGTTMTLDVPLEMTPFVELAGLNGANAGGGRFPNSSQKHAQHSPVVFDLPATAEILTVVGKKSLGDAIGRLALAGDATHTHLLLARRFPHTETQQVVWAAEVARLLHQAWQTKACVVVLEEAFLLPLWNEWFRSRISFSDIPPIVLLVGKKITPSPWSDDLQSTRPSAMREGGGDKNTLRRRASRQPTGGGGHASTPNQRDAFTERSRGGGGGNGGDDGDENDFTHGWRSLLRETRQVIRPVKPSALRDALLATDGELRRRGSGAPLPAGGSFGFADTRHARAQQSARSGGVHGLQNAQGVHGLHLYQGQHASNQEGAYQAPPSPLARHSVVDDSHVALGAAAVGNQSGPPSARRNAVAAATVPARVTRSKSRRASAVEISEIAEEEDPLGYNTARNAVDSRGGFGWRGAVDSGGNAATPSFDRGNQFFRAAGTRANTNPPPPAVHETDPIGNGAVLIVEDNLMNQKVAQVVVKRCGMSSVVANNGREAIDLLQKGGQYDVILMDIQMPVLDGLDATREIRALEASGAITCSKNAASRNFIVAVSANAAAEDHQQGFEAGMDEYVTKPIYPTRLRELLMMPKSRET